jgi:hypothetical protein
MQNFSNYPKSPMLKRLTKSNRKIVNQRKRLLFDNYEHRVVLTTKWEWVSYYFTCAVALITLLSELLFFRSDDFINANPFTRVSYYIVSLLVGNIPFIWLVGKGIYYGKSTKKIKNNTYNKNLNNNDSDTNVTTKLCFYVIDCTKLIMFNVFVMPIWLLAGIILFSSKIICITSVCKTWWSILSVLNIHYPSSSSGLLSLKMESEKLNINDVILSSTQKRRRGSNSLTSNNINSVNIVKEIKQNADLRRKRLVNNMLDLPRDDLTVDIALLNKLVFLELFLKFLPQLILSFSINKSKFMIVHNNNFDVIPLLIFIVSCISTISSARSNWEILINRSWASTFRGNTSTIQHHQSIEHDHNTENKTSKNRNNANIVNCKTPSSKEKMYNRVINKKNKHHNNKNRAHTHIFMSPNTKRKRDAINASLVKKLKEKNDVLENSNGNQYEYSRDESNAISNTTTRISPKIMSPTYRNDNMKNILSDISNFKKIN